MNLLDIRKQFVEVTGRFDLVEDAVSFVDKGADFYINSGVKYLDRKENVKKSWSRSFTRAAIGDWYALIQNSRAIKKVWASNSTGERWELEKADFDILKAAYAEDPTNITQDSPLYYSPVRSLRKEPESWDISPSSELITIDYFYDTEYTETGKHFTYDAIVFMPPTDEAIRIEVEGLFYSPELNNDEDENFWTAVHPLAVVMAAARSLSLANKDHSGARDWEASIGIELMGIGMDHVEEDVADIDDMEG